jgi:hypothetical protein
VLRDHVVNQLSDPREYVGTGDADRGSLDEEGMAYRSRIEAYQRIRTVILRDAWLIDSDHKEDEEEGASETGSDEGTPDAASTEGSARWLVVGCTKLARAGTAQKCSAHGVGKRCAEPNCTKSAQGATDRC